MRLEEEIKQKKFSGPQQKAILNILFTAGWLQAKNNQFLKQYGITAAQFNILRILKGQHPDSLSVGEIKSRMLDRNSDMPRLLNRLLIKGLIDKRTCPKDKRASDVFISPTGIELLERINRQQDVLDNMIQLTDSEAQQLSDLLDKARNG